MNLNNISLVSVRKGSFSALGRLDRPASGHGQVRDSVEIGLRRWHRQGLDAPRGGT